MSAPEHALIRPRRHADLDQCAQLLVKVHQTDGYPVEGVANPVAWLTPASVVESWVAELGGRIVGHVSVVTVSDTDEVLTLWQQRSPDRGAGVLGLARLFVGIEARRRSVGEQLVRAGTEYARSRKQDLILDVMAKDRAAIRLYERLGWVELGEITHRFAGDREVPAYGYGFPWDSDA